MPSGRVSVKVDLRALKSMLANAKQTLEALDSPCRDEARRTIDIASFLVPRGDPNDDSDLAGTAFLSGPIYNMDVLSTTFLAGYDHPAAGAIHAGFHWGHQTENPPPEWLRKAFNGAKGRAQKGVATAVDQLLRRFFPAT